MAWLKGPITCRVFGSSASPLLAVSRRFKSRLSAAFFGLLYGSTKKTANDPTRPYRWIFVADTFKVVPQVKRENSRI